MSTDDLPQPGPQPGGGAAPGPTPGPPPGTGDPAPEGATPPRRPAGDGFFDSIRRMGVTRSDERWVGGVAGGIADRFGLDPLLVRGLLILSFFLTGAGIVIYAVAWALLPERRDGRIHLQQAVRGDFDVALLGAVIAFVVGVAWNDGLWSWGFGLFDWVGGVLWVAIWVAVIWLIVKLVRDRRSRRGAPGAPGGPGGPAASGGPGAPGGPAGPGGPGVPTPYGPTAYGPTPPVASSPAPSAPTPHPATEPSAPPPGRADRPGPGAHFTPAPAAPYLAQQAPAPAAGTPRPVYATTPAPAAPPAPPQPPRPPKVRRRGPGAGTVGIVTGVVLIIGALLLVVDRAGDLGAPLGPTWLGASIAVLGLGLVVCGLRGRRGGGLSWLASLALVAGLITWPFAGSNVWTEWQDSSPAPDGAVVSQGTITPTTADEAEDGVVVRFGSATVDLTELDLSEVPPGEPVVVPISMSAGSTLVLIPEDAAVEAEVQVIAGNVSWHADERSRSVNTYTDGPVEFATDEVREAGGATLVLDVAVRAGDLTIQEASR